MEIIIQTKMISLEAGLIRGWAPIYFVENY